MAIIFINKEIETKHKTQLLFKILKPAVGEKRIDGNYFLRGLITMRTAV